jgi:hypothetical protein
VTIFPRPKKTSLDLVPEGQVIREEQEGFKFMLDLQKRDKQEAIARLEAILARYTELTQVKIRNARA